MTKTFTCRELGGICDEKITGETFEEIIQKGVAHIQGDEAHKEKMMSMSGDTGETREQWFERMKKEFDEREEDAVTE